MATFGGNHFISSVQGFEKVQFDWMATQRKAAAELIPHILRELKKEAPVSATKPDAGRFRNSIGYRIESAPGLLKIKFVSTAPYAQYVIEPTAPGAIITPTNTQALRFGGNGGNDYVFAKSVVRGATPGNDFNKVVARRVEPLVVAAFTKSFTFIYT